eukprot:scaffold3761_cov372-Prasinococcus_capsulatus_cf.AAC.30
MLVPVLTPSGSCGSVRRSGAIPARAVFTISVMLLAVYGASVIVYVKDGLGWLGIPGLEKAGEGALCWVTPVRPPTTDHGI